LYRANDDGYEPQEPLGGDRLKLRFEGRFDGRPVTWEATFYTLGRLAREQPATPWRNFIDIGEPRGDSVPLKVGLNVEKLDNRTVIMAITMIRQYKRLRRGRHEYGPTYDAR